MSGKFPFNGSDYLMLGFDYELRRQGYAGNSCQIILELASVLPLARLQERLDDLSQRYPVLCARPGGWFSRRWQLPGKRVSSPRVRVHPAEAAPSQRWFNEPLATRQGELLRFDLVESGQGKMTLIFTWAHALMDAPGAEQFLVALGSGENTLLEMPATLSAGDKLRLAERFKLGWKNLHQLDHFCQAAPRSLGLRHPQAPSALCFRVEKFSADDTIRIRGHGARLCGVLGDAQYHAAVSVVELHRLHQTLGCPSPSYVLPLPVGLRPKGSVGPLFGNQIGMLMIQFLPEQLNSVADAAATLKAQTAQALREGLLESGRVLAELFRFLPLPLYMALIKHGLRGEIGSLFFGDTAAVNPWLTSFLGVPVEDFAHVAAVTPSPGVEVIFYYFRGTLRFTVVHSAKTLSETEAADFAASLRARLLNP
ncbi:MAG: hypothetical protein KIS67_26140 [Verrucomicrobiae bacterium]|nr:hypothetical protein [Verrucomicrobiae bacterium]